MFGTMAPAKQRRQTAARRDLSSERAASSGGDAAAAVDPSPVAAVEPSPVATVDAGATPPVGASASEVAAIPPAAAGDEACAICKISIYDGTPFTHLVCGHPLHNECINGMMAVGNCSRETLRCPTCRNSAEDLQRQARAQGIPPEVIPHAGPAIAVEDSPGPLPLREGGPF